MFLNKINKNNKIIKSLTALDVLDIVRSHRFSNFDYYEMRPAINWVNLYLKEFSFSPVNQKRLAKITIQILGNDSKNSKKYVLDHLENYLFDFENNKIITKNKFIDLINKERAV